MGYKVNVWPAVINVAIAEVVLQPVFNVTHHFSYTTNNVLKNALLAIITTLLTENVSLAAKTALNVHRKTLVLSAIKIPQINIFQKDFVRQSVELKRLNIFKIV